MVERRTVAVTREINEEGRKMPELTLTDFMVSGRLYVC